MSTKLVYFLFLFVFQCWTTTESIPPPLDIQAVVITSEYLKPRSICEDNEVEEAKTDNSTDKLYQLRQQLLAEGISAYIILSRDEHQVEFIPEHSKRLQYISGFSGNNGTAVVTLKSAALWTNEKSFSTAQEELDCNWLIMKSGEPGIPTIGEWISSQIESGETVAADSRIFSYKMWKKFSDDLAKYNLTLEPVEDNLIDRIWTEEMGRPLKQDNPLLVLDVTFTGLTWQEKLTVMRDAMARSKVNLFVFTALDEIAWLLNLRGTDYTYTPIFDSYFIVHKTSAFLYISQTKMTPDIIKHLNANSTISDKSVKLNPLNAFWEDLPKISQSCQSVGLPERYSYFPGVSEKIRRLVPAEKISMIVSPALLVKDQKNAVEAAGMRASHIRDGVAVCQFLCQLEEEVTSGKGNWTELKAVKVLNGLRMQQKHILSPSFGTIVAFGKNGDDFHYQPTPETNAVIDTTQLLMLDSGGQYYDGTTDATRTLHFGTPKDREKEIYTRLLQGCINVATTVFKPGQYNLTNLESDIRVPLKQIGLNYAHGSCHGIGHGLYVHESFNKTFNLNFFGSQEPGYYEKGQFGMRLENIASVIKSSTCEFSEEVYTFETVTMIPYERKLMKIELLSRKHINWINEYHAKVRELVGAEMKRQGLHKEYKWLVRKTEPISA